MFNINRRRLRYLIRHSIWFLVIVFFTGCAATLKAPNLSEITPEDIKLKVSRNFQKLSSFEGKARVIIELPGEGYNGFSKIFINFPDSIYVKTEAILGIDIGALFLDSQYFGAYAPRENILYYGEVETLDLRDFLQVEIDTGELVEVFTGLTQIASDSKSTLSFEDGKFLISGSVSDGVLKYWVDPQKYIVTKSQLLNPQGKVVLIKEYQRFKKKEGIVLPQIIKITRPISKERITVYYTNQKINQSIAPGQFRLKLSRNARRIYWGDVEQPQINRGGRDKLNSN